MTGSTGRIDIAIADDLRSVFDGAGYSASAIREAFGLPATVELWSGEAGALVRAALADRATDADRTWSALDALVGLFLIGATVDAPAAIEQALEPLRIADLDAGGIVDVSHEGVRSRLRIVPEGDLLIASDRAVTGKRYVPGVNSAALTLSSLTVRRPGGTALDLGTGNGFQALRAAAHAGSVTGTDINQRALRLAAFASRLNGIGNVAWRRGNWFEPVKDERFDLVVANPPYVISPDTAHLYRDSGLPGDTVSEAVVKAAPQHLREGGFASIMCNWVHGEDWSAPLRRWVADSGCDALLLHYGTNDPLTYAGRWNQPLRDTDLRAFRRTVDRWLRYYDERGIEAIGFGGVVLRRRSVSSNWVRAIEPIEGPSGPAGEHLVRIVDGEDWLQKHPLDADVLNAHLILVDGHRLDQTLTYGGGHYEARPAVMRLLAGAGLAATVDPRLLEILFNCDGSRRLGVLVDEVAAGQDQDDLAALAAANAKRLLADGLLTLAEER